MRALLQSRDHLQGVIRQACSYLAALSPAAAAACCCVTKHGCCCHRRRRRRSLEANEAGGQSTLRTCWLLLLAAADDVDDNGDKHRHSKWTDMGEVVGVPRSLKRSHCGTARVVQADTVWSLSIGVAPGGAGGTLAPPPLKVGGPGPPTF